jgi:glycosyltransferase involved in cell wall biosynthesis
VTEHATAQTRRAEESDPANSSLNGLFIVPATFEALEKKGVVAGILDRDEQGFLSSVVTVHPFAQHDRLIRLNDRCLVYELEQPASTVRVVLWIIVVAHLVRSMRLVHRLIHDHRIHFVRAHAPDYIGLIGWVAARLGRVPFCISIHADYDKMHELDPTGGAPRVLGSRRLARGLERFLLRRADRVLVISEYIGRYALSHGAAPSDIRLFRHAIPLSDFDCTRQRLLGDARRPLAIGVVSRLSRQKFIYDIVAIADSLRKRGVDIVIKVAGDGEERAGLHRAVERAGLEGAVQLIGFQSHENLARLHAECDLHLSLICGASLVEACASGVCVVGYDVEWQSELIVTGKSGILVPEGDCEAAAAAIARLSTDEAERIRLGEAGRGAARTMFEPTSLRESRRKVYRELAYGQ